MGIRVITKYKLHLIIERETSFGAGALASLFSGRPMILEIIGPRYSRMSAWKSKVIFYYTESMLRKWVDKRKCVVIPAGVNLSIFRDDKRLEESQRKKLGFEPDHIIIGYVGTFQDWHGIDDLLAALPSLRQKFSKLRALLVGPYFERYQKMSEASGVSDICLFTGGVNYEEVPALINACDIMVALYNPNANSLRRKYGIGSPIKILEYMACGKPVVSTRVEPINQIIHDDKDGMLVEPGKPSEVEKCIEALLENQVKMHELAANGKYLAETRYSWSSVASTISSYF